MSELIRYFCKATLQVEFVDFTHHEGKLTLALTNGKKLGFPHTGDLLPQLELLKAAATFPALASFYPRTTLEGKIASLQLYQVIGSPFIRRPRGFELIGYALPSEEIPDLLSIMVIPQKTAHFIMTLTWPAQANELQQKLLAMKPLSKQVGIGIRAIGQFEGGKLVVSHLEQVRIHNNASVEAIMPKVPPKPFQKRIVPAPEPVKPPEKKERVYQDRQWIK